MSDVCGCDSVPPVPSGEIMSVSDAMARALSQISPIAETQSVSIGDACGRVTQRAVFAINALPLFDNSAMDGFALCCADLDGRESLPIAGTVSAGERPGTLPEGAAMRIYTGAPLPKGADAVAMVERCHEAEGKVCFTHRPVPGDNIRRKGSDQAQGQMLIPSQTRLGPRHIGLLAANGIDRIGAVRRPRVAVFSTGDELGPDVKTPGKIPDANRPMLLALAHQAGADVTDLGILPDDLEATKVAFEGIGDRFDLILTSGAVSMGGKDHIRDALVAAGGHVAGWRVAMKPGKPVLFGTLGRTACTGLPGNPLAVYVNFQLFVAPQISRLMGMKPAPFANVPARAGFDWVRKPGRAEIFPARLATYNQAGVPVLERLGRGVSATLLPLAEADGLAIVPADIERVRYGDGLHWHPFCRSGEMR